jgi:hypothetical protein
MLGKNLPLRQGLNRGLWMLLTNRKYMFIESKGTKAQNQKNHFLKIL